MRKLALIIVLLASCSLAKAQQGNTVLITFPGIPSGSCSIVMVALNTATGDFYDCFLGAWHSVGPGGGGTVSSFSSGNLSPLFTTSVVTATTTPALSFSLSNAAAFTMFANNTSSAAAPGYTTFDSIFGSCSDAASAMTFDTTIHAFGCNTISGSSTTLVGSGLLTGGQVVWTGNLGFSVSPATYMIGGNQYSSALTALTLTAASNSNPRIDVFALDTTGTAVKITGTASTPPSKPSIDPTTQVEIGFAYVDTSATAPSNFTNVNVYLENTEWTCTASANFNCASTSNPYAGTKDIEATTATTGNNVTLVKPAAGTENLSNYNSLVFYIRSKASWPGARSLIFYWLNGSTIVGQAVTLKNSTFTFSSSNTSTYQQIVIPLSLFGTGQNLVTTLEAQVAGTGSTIGFYLDNILLQGGANGSASPVVQFADNIIPTGSINSSNQAFTIPQVPSPVTSLKCSGNGIAFKPTSDYTFNASTATITTVGTFQTGDTGLVCSYRY